MSFPAEARYIARRLLRSPIFTATTILTLALGVGATTAIFSLVWAVLFKPLPYPEPDRLAGVWHTAPGLGIRELNASPATYFTYREEGKTFEDIALYSSGAVNLTGIAEPERVPALYVTDGFLPLLRVQPLLGRRFTLADDTPGTPETVMLTHGYWREKYGGDRLVIGRTIQINGQPREVIGVLPEGFSFLDISFSFLLPQRFRRSEVFVGNFSYEAVARLKPGVSFAQAHADVARMLPLHAAKFPPAPGMNLKMIEDARLGPDVHPLREDLIGDIGRVLWVLMATVGIVLLIACANVANLLLVRVEGRQRELAVRAALGASWGRLVRELLAESVGLSLVGGALGLGIAKAALALLVKLGPTNLPRLNEASLDLPVLAFAVAVSLLSGLLFGMVPAFKYARPDIDQSLRAEGRSGSTTRERQRTRGALVAGQVAMALVLLVGAGLMLRTLYALRGVDPGFRSPAEVLTFRLSIPGSVFPDTRKAALAFQQIHQRIADLPGVSSVAISNSITMSGENNNDPIFPEGRTDFENKLPPVRRYKHISPGYFSTLGNRLVAGRDFTWSEVMEARPVLIVSENLAREFWGSPANALGKRARESAKGSWREIVGVAAPERDNGAHRDAPAIAYWPYLKSNFWGEGLHLPRTMAFAVRSPRTGTPDFFSEIRRAVWSVNGDLPLANVRTLEEVQKRSMARTSFTLVMLAIAAGMALLLGVIGIYGVISYSVAQRTREIGIRIALGAEAAAVRRLFVRQGLLLAGLGVVAGLGCAIPLSRYLASLLYGVQPFDPVTYVAVAALLILIALTATYLPARRASAVEPVEALRAD